MDRISSKLVIAIACAILLSPPILPAEPAGAVEVGTHSLLIQGFEAADVLEEKPHVSYLSGVPEDAEVEVWDNALYRRKRIPHRESGIVCEVSSRHKKQGAASLRVKFTRDDRVLRVSLRNNINQPSRDGVRPACNSIGCFDRLVGDIFNPIAEPVAVRLRMLGGFAVTDKAATFSLVRNLTLKPGWNEFSVSSQEASATFVDPHDATCVEFCVPAARGQELYFDNFRMERETIGKNLAKYAKCFDFGVAHFNWPGFAYGSVGWDEQRGYGFTRGERLTHGGDLHVINDQLTRDGFEAPASFRVKLPNGAYKVVCQTGNYWAQRDGGLNIEIRAEGKRVYYRPRMSGREYLAFKFAHENTDHWKRDLDLWGTYDEGTYFRTVTFDTVVEDGALDLDFLLPAAEGTHGRSIWTYLIVYPAEKNKLIQPELTWLNEKIRTIYNKVSHVPFSRQFGLYNREEVICAEEFLWPDLAAARRRSLAAAGEAASRGYLHFLRHHHDLITPDSVPRPDETGDSIAVFGTPGETVQWAVGLYPLRDLKGVSISLGDFKDASGKTVIAGPEADVRLVSYRPMTPAVLAEPADSRRCAGGALPRPGTVQSRRQARLDRAGRAAGAPVRPRGTQERKLCRGLPRNDELPQRGRTGGAEVLPGTRDEHPLVSRRPSALAGDAATGPAGRAQARDRLAGQVRQLALAAGVPRGAHTASPGSGKGRLLSAQAHRPSGRSQDPLHSRILAVAQRHPPPGRSDPSQRR